MATESRTICWLKAKINGNSYLVFIYDQYKTNYSNMNVSMQAVKKIGWNSKASFKIDLLESILVDWGKICNEKIALNLHWSSWIVM